MCENMMIADNELGHHQQAYSRTEKRQLIANRSQFCQARLSKSQSLRQLMLTPQYRDMVCIALGYRKRIMRAISFHPSSMETA